MDEQNASRRVVPTDSQPIDAAFLVRLFLGALSEHEQRLATARLLRLDADLRKTMAALLQPFEMFDLDLIAEYDQILRDSSGADFEDQRHQILSEAFERADLDKMLRHFTFYDLLQLGETTCKLFSWSMAEMLLQRTCRVGVPEHEIHTSLYLAILIIDVVEILGAAGRSPEFPAVVSDVRLRIAKAQRALPPHRGL